MGLIYVMEFVSVASYLILGVGLLIVGCNSLYSRVICKMKFFKYLMKQISTSRRWKEIKKARDRTKRR